MNKFDEVRAALEKRGNDTADKAKKLKSSNGYGWEVSAYVLRGLSVAVPSGVIMCLENSWVKTGMGLLATLLIISLFLIYKEPIKKMMGYAPGVIPFACFVVISVFFQTTANALLTIGISGLAGSIAAVPLHLKYLSVQKQAKSATQTALENIAETLEKMK